MPFRSRTLFFALFFLLPAVLSSAQEPAGKSSRVFDHSLWDSFLKKYVNEAGQVDYTAAKKDTAELDAYIKKISSIRSFLHLEWPREEKLAYWPNAYHALLTKIILDHYPVKSVLDIPSVWDQTVLKIENETYSLNQIRSSQLIGTFRDEKINAVLACSAKSCPRLSREAFTGPKVEGQLYMLTRNFVNDPAFNEIVPGNKKVKLSRIFKWHAGDFTLDFGREENERGLKYEEYAVLSFVGNYLDDTAKREYLEQGKYKIKYFPFDWSLAESSSRPS